MKLLTNKILVPAALCVAGLISSCTSDNASVQEGTSTEIRLRGLSDAAKTRVGMATQAPIYLMAYSEGDMSQRYIEPTRIISSTDLGISPEEFTLQTKRYYPLGDNKITFFAYTGTPTSVNSSFEMSLVAGTGPSNDYVLSNYGKRESDTDVDESRQGKGTLGSAQDPAEILQFRHVMTQLEVVVEVDTTETNYVDPAPKLVNFRLNGIQQNGLYPITAPAPDPQSPGQVVTAEPSGDLYTVNLGMNYLIPSGLDLIGKTFSYLKIDDYTATASDLAQFVITGDDPQMYLYPGYSYRLVLKIQKLRLIGVELLQKEWDPKEIDGNNPTYDPNVLSLDISGGYDNSGDDEITRVVLHSTERRQYVGQLDDQTGELDFVTLPPANEVDSVDLYTAKGLLVSMPVDPAQYNSNTLSFFLSPVGMLLADPNDPVNSPANPYLITTLAQFLNIEKDLSGYYRQESDIELEDIGFSGINASFTGFGIFKGVYDGNSHWIGHLDISCQGLFDVNEGTLLNVRIYTGNMNVSGYPYAGALCGTNRGLIYGCINEAQLFGATATVGGICGLNDTNGRVIACVNTGNIRQGTILGGICGENRNTTASTFVACISTGDIYNGGTCGGVIGYTQNAPSTVVIYNCYWLAGSVEAGPGSDESVFGAGVVGYDDTAALDPDKMRNGIDEGETDADKVLNKLNAAIAAVSDYNGLFRYVLSPVVTGITWPMPFYVNNIP